MSLWTSKPERKTEQELGAWEWEGGERGHKVVTTKQVGKKNKRIWDFMGYEGQKERKVLHFLLHKNHIVQQATP